MKCSLAIFSVGHCLNFMSPKERSFAVPWDEDSMADCHKAALKDTNGVASGDNARHSPPKSTSTCCSSSCRRRHPDLRASPMCELEIIYRRKNKMTPCLTVSFGVVLLPLDSVHHELLELLLRFGACNKTRSVRRRTEATSLGTTTPYRQKP